MLFMGTVGRAVVLERRLLGRVLWPHVQLAFGIEYLFGIDMSVDHT